MSLRSRSRFFIPFACLCLFAVTAVGLASVSFASDQHEWLVQALSFEGKHVEGRPFGWSGGPPETISVDEETVHGGKWSARIDRDGESPGRFSALTLSLPVEFKGGNVELHGFLRTQDVEGAAGLWLREDGATGPVQFDNMAGRSLSGTADWAEHSIVLPLDPGARKIFFGALLGGTGTLWVDDLRLLVDGKPVWEAPRGGPEKTILETDTEFAEGSGIRFETGTGALSKIQVDNLGHLARVWGFLKYHHPRIASGELHWDSELFRAMPGVLAAKTPEERNRALLHWVRRLGEAPPCDPCASRPEGAHLLPTIDWIFDSELLGQELSDSLAQTYERRYTGAEHFFVHQQADIGNPIFDHELAYADFTPPDAGYRLLALFRLWNIIEYWFPYRDQIDGDWEAVLAEFVPRLVAAREPDRYRLELMALIARVSDTHANLWRELKLRPPRGDCRLPVQTRFIEGKAVVTAHTPVKTSASTSGIAATGQPESGGAVTGLEIGDVIRQLDGRPVEELIAAWSPYYAASNEPVRRRALGGSLTRGACGEVSVEIERQGTVRQLTLKRLATGRLDLASGSTYDRPGDTFQLLSPEVAYLKLSSVTIADVESYIERAKNTRGWVIDIRNYPTQSMVFELGQRLVREPTPFVRFTIGDLSNPGAFLWSDPLVLTPSEPSYDGKVVILVNEVSQSHAEFTAMALSAGPQAIIAGSTTAGADGNISPIVLPGGVSTMISGIGVFYPDKRPTQRIGIVPDIRVEPTVAGIREGRDEVLEAALRAILGNSAGEAKIRTLAAPNSSVETPTTSPKAKS